MDSSAEVEAPISILPRLRERDVDSTIGGEPGILISMADEKDKRTPRDLMEDLVEEAVQKHLAELYETRITDLKEAHEAELARFGHMNGLLSDHLREARQEGTLVIEGRNRRFVERVQPLIGQAKKDGTGVDPEVLEHLLAILDVGATIRRST